MIPQDQNSKEWFQWRRVHIGASDLPIILGKSKWCSPYLLWQRKLGFAPEQEENWAMRRGKDNEAMILRRINEERCADFVPAVIVHEEFEWASASLDGWDKELDTIVEIKCPCLADHQLAEKGLIPEHYFPQLQWQMFIADITMCIYVSCYGAFHSEGEPVTVTVIRDDDYLSTVALPSAMDFRRCLLEYREPAKIESDYTQITDPEFEQFAREWKAAHEMAAQYKEKEQYYKDKLVAFTDDGNCTGSGLRLTRVNRQGAIEWLKLWKEVEITDPEVTAKYSPESYRKEQIGFWKITTDK